MTIASETNKSGPYFGNGVTTSFDYDFKIFDEAHIRVVQAIDGVETDLTLATDYTVTGVGDSAGGAVIIPGAPDTGTAITLVRAVPFTQELDLQNQGAYYAEVVEAAFDRAVARDQQLAEELGRTVKVPVSTDPTDLETLIAGVVDLLGIVDDVATVAGIADDVSTVADIADDVTTTAGLASEITQIASGSGIILPGSVLPASISALPQDWIGGASVNRLLRHSFYDDLNSAWYCERDGSDETENFRDFIAAIVSGGQGNLAAGTHSFSQEIEIDHPVHLHGGAPDFCRLVSTSTTANLLKITTRYAMVMKHFALHYDTVGGKSAGTAVLVDVDPGLMNIGSVFEGLQIANFPTGIHLKDAAAVTIRRVNVLNYLNAGFIVDNENYPDSGDSEISGCNIDTTLLTGQRAGIVQYRSGGLRLVSNKFFRGRYGFLLDPTGTVTSILEIANNSIEHQEVGCISITDGDVDFTQVLITGNHMNGQQVAPNPVYPGGASPTLLNVVGTSGAKVKNVTIANNNMQLGLDGGIGMQLEYIDNLNLAPNIIIATTGASRTGVSIGANVNGTIAAQETDGLVDAYLINAAAALARIPRKQSGTVTCSTNASDGALYTGPGVAVTFPVPFGETPTVTLQAVGGSNGEVGGRALSPSKTGFTAYALGTNNGSSMTLAYTATGL